VKPQINPNLLSASLRSAYGKQEPHRGFSTLQQLIEQQRGDENRLINNEGRVRLSARASLRC